MILVSVITGDDDDYDDVDYNYDDKLLQWTDSSALDAQCDS